MLKTVCIFLVCFAVAAAQLMTVTTKAAESCPDENKAAPGMKLSMHYTGKIAESSATGTKGKVFDSSIPRGQPFEFVLGRGQVIAGWDQGLDGICVGEKRELTIPPDMGYGDRGAGADIPGGATLHFEVECLAVGPPGLEPPQPNIFEEIDRDHSHTLTLEEITFWFTTVRKMDAVPEGLWAKEDKNGDGIVTWEEFEGPKGSSDPSKGEL